MVGLFSYSDTQRHRLGTNYLMLPINRPLSPVTNNSQDGAMNFGATASDVNYEPSNAPGSPIERPNAKYSQAPVSGHVRQDRITKTLEFAQAGELYRSFSPDRQAHLIANLSGDLKRVGDRQVRLRMLSFFYQADSNYGERLATALGEPLDDVKVLIAATRNVDPLQWRKAVTETAPSATHD